MSAHATAHGASYVSGQVRTTNKWAIPTTGAPRGPRSSFSMASHMDEVLVLLSRITEPPPYQGQEHQHDEPSHPTCSTWQLVGSLANVVCEVATQQRQDPEKP